jgi:hypothetical protein
MHTTFISAYDRSVPTSTPTSAKDAASQFDFISDVSGKQPSQHQHFTGKVRLCDINEC